MNRDIKISMLSTLPPIKGISDYTLGLIQALSKKCEIDFYGFKSIYPEFLYPGSTKTNKKEPQINNVYIHNYLTWYNPLSWIKTGLTIKTKMLHVQSWSWILAPMFLVILSIVRLRKKIVIMTVHNIKPHERSIIRNFLNKCTFKLANKYIVHSNNNKKIFLKEYETNKKIYVVPMGIIEMEKSELSKNFLREKYGFNIKDNILLFWGNIREYKGLDILLKALAKIKDKKIKLIIAGKAWGNFKDYQNIIDQFNLKERIRLYLEFIPDKKLAEIIKLSDVCIFPYKKFEASSASLMASLHYRKPVIVTDVGGLSEVLENKNFVVKANDPIDLKEKIIKIFENPNKNYSENITEKFSWHNIINNLLKIYEC